MNRPTRHLTPRLLATIIPATIIITLAIFALLHWGWPAALTTIAAAMAGYLDATIGDRRAQFTLTLRRTR